MSMQPIVYRESSVSERAQAAYVARVNRTREYLAVLDACIEKARNPAAQQAGEERDAWRSRVRAKSRHHEDVIKAEMRAYGSKAWEPKP